MKIKTASDNRITISGQGMAHRDMRLLGFLAVSKTLPVLFNCEVSMTKNQRELAEHCDMRERRQYRHLVQQMDHQERDNISEMMVRNTIEQGVHYGQ